MRKVILALIVGLLASLAFVPNAQADHTWEHPTQSGVIADRLSPQVELGQVGLRQPHQALGSLRSNFGARGEANWMMVRARLGSYWNDEDGDNLKCASLLDTNYLRKVRFTYQIFLRDPQSGRLNPYAQFKQPERLVIDCKNGTNMVAKARLAEDHRFWFDKKDTGWPQVRFGFHWNKSGVPDVHQYEWEEMTPWDNDRQAPLMERIREALRK